MQVITSCGYRVGIEIAVIRDSALLVELAVIVVNIVVIGNVVAFNSRISNEVGVVLQELEHSLAKLVKSSLIRCTNHIRC